jgi:mannose-6-phosphate isomerase-like protein (cupin superfamily)
MSNTKQSVEQVQEIHRKGWGRELWIVNKSEYCSKILSFRAGKKCSWHYHDVKDEVFYLLSGMMSVFYSDGDDRAGAQEVVLYPGDTFHVYPGLRHQMHAYKNSELLEVSTQHFEDDSIRIEKGD